MIDIRRREEERASAGRRLFAQTSMKVPDGRQAPVYGDEYTPLHYDREYKEHDERQEALYRQALEDRRRADQSSEDNVSESILKKKKRQVSFKFESSQ